MPGTTERRETGRTTRLNDNTFALQQIPLYSRANKSQKNESQGGAKTEELDEQEKNLLREYCKEATKRSRYITTGGGYSVYDPKAEPEKREVAESLEYKGYITPPKGLGSIVTRDLTREGVNYCNEEEQKNRNHLRLAAEQARTRLPRPIALQRIIDGIEYDTGDPETRLIGEINIGSASYIGETTREEFHKDLKQLWRTKDGHYFFYGSVGGLEPIDSEAAHAAMNTTIGYRRFLTDAQLKELEEEDKMTL
jgi:hypothetical protein